jgi:Secretion system C-terminal sorting domain
MKNFLRVFSTIFLFCVPYFASAQVTNLKVDNVSSNFSMTSGDTIKWEYNCPVGASVLLEVWYDVNGNGTIDPGTDVEYGEFTQTDGASGHNGPGDLDGSVNGHIIFYQRVGIAPGSYVLRFTNGGSSVTEAGTILPLASPAHTISGHVTPPLGKSAQNIDVQIDRSQNSGEPNSWDAMTDAFGNYQIAMNADTAGNPWYVQIQTNPYPPSIITPQDTSITIVGNPSGINLVMLTAAAQVAGDLKDDSGVSIQSSVYADVSLPNSPYRYTQTNSLGFFQLGFLQSDIDQTSSQHWMLSASTNGDSIGNNIIPQILLPILHTGDSLFYNLVFYTVNSTIQGVVQFNGQSVNYPFQLIASNPDTAYSFTSTDNAGNFTMKVSNKIFNYNLNSQYGLPPNEQVQTVIAHPGETGVVLNVMTTSVRDASAKIPAVFALSQNYPNPFNPTTEIQFTVPSNGRAVLKVFNVLGQEVATLFDGQAEVGTIHQAQFNATNLASGVYFSRLEFGGKVQMRKMLLLK